MEKPFRSQSLACWCCWCWFNTWEWYEDQDQDHGYWICKRCQDEEEKRNKRQYEDLFKQVIEWWNENTKNKIYDMIKKMGYEKTKNIIVNMGLDQWRFKRSIEKGKSL